MFFGGWWRGIFLGIVGLVHSNVDVKAICRSSEMQILLDGMYIIFCHDYAVPNYGSIVDFHVYIVLLADALHFLPKILDFLFALG